MCGGRGDVERAGCAKGRSRGLQGWVEVKWHSQLAATSIMGTKQPLLFGCRCLLAYGHKQHINGHVNGNATHLIKA